MRLLFIAGYYAVAIFLGYIIAVALVTGTEYRIVAGGVSITDHAGNDVFSTEISANTLVLFVVDCDSVIKVFLDKDTDICDGYIVLSKNPAFLVAFYLLSALLAVLVFYLFEKTARSVYKLIQH